MLLNINLLFIDYFKIEIVKNLVIHGKRNDMISSWVIVYVNDVVIYYCFLLSLVPNCNFYYDY